MTTPSITSRQSVPTTKFRFVEAIAICARLRKLVRSQLSTVSDFRSLERVVEAIPIAADEYTWLRARVRNARVYTQQRELGAAEYELALVANRLLTHRRLWQEAATDNHNGVQGID
jgi:hypothetical protein